jgi:hypothetical protein
MSPVDTDPYILIFSLFPPFSGSFLSIAAAEMADEAGIEGDILFAVCGEGGEIILR